MDAGLDAMDLVGVGWFDDGGGADGYGDREFDAGGSAIPAHDRFAVGSVVSRFGEVELRGRVRPDGDLAVSRCGGSESGHAPVHPVRDRAERVVVERGHLARVDRAVGQHAVPPLPDGRGAHPDGVEPGRQLGLEQQPMRVVDVTGDLECVADQRRADESRADAPVAVADELSKALPRGIPRLLVGEQVPEDRHGVRGLRVGVNGAIGCRRTHG